MGPLLTAAVSCLCGKGPAEARYSKGGGSKTGRGPAPTSRTPHHTTPRHATPCPALPCPTPTPPYPTLRHTILAVVVLEGRGISPTGGGGATTTGPDATHPPTLSVKTWRGGG